MSEGSMDVDIAFGYEMAWKKPSLDHAKATSKCMSYSVDRMTCSIHRAPSGVTR